MCVVTCKIDCMLSSFLPIASSDFRFYSTNTVYSAFFPPTPARRSSRNQPVELLHFFGSHFFAPFHKLPKTVASSSGLLASASGADGVGVTEGLADFVVSSPSVDHHLSATAW